jgi:phosphoribosyl 1,2-cyclic phosphodiesterase
LLLDGAEVPNMIDIRFWGVRGSIATGGQDTAGVGGNTSCVEVRGPGDELVILDAGTGLRGLGTELERRGEKVRAHLLLSHLHWDHIQGFPFFTPAFREGNELAVYAPERCAGPSGDVRRAMAMQMAAPHFPVGLEAMRASMSFRAIGAGMEWNVGALTVRAAAARHPNGCLAYRVEHDEGALVYATDTEHDPHRGGVDPSLVELARGAEVLIYDSQYTEDEYAGRHGPCRHGWGHSTPDQGVRLADAAGVSQLVLFHHDPTHDDLEIASIERAAAALRPGTVAAREGMTLALRPRQTVAA